MEYNTFQNRIPLLAIKDNPEWQLYQFDEILIDDTKSATKIKKEDYLEIGEYPIIDQGQSVIAGYTEDVDGVYDAKEVIIFGDHTRAIKYADFPLFLGADGVKLLKAKYGKSKINMKYIYYFLRTIELPSDGYSRHFKYLKQVIIPLPSVEIQKKVVKILDAMNEVMDKRKEQIASCDELIKSQFIEMFGDPINNPKGWDVKKLKDLSTKILSGNTPKGGSNVYVEDGIMFFRSQNVWKNRLELDDIAYINQKTHESMSKSSLKHRDILMTKTGRINTENSSLGVDSHIIYT